MSRQVKEILNEELNTVHTIFKDIRKIALDYIPGKILFREPEIKQLAQYAKPVFSSLINSNNKLDSNFKPFHQSFSVFVIGNQSTGKTATVKRFGMDLEKFARRTNAGFTFYFKYINCIRYRTIYSIMISLIQVFVPNFPNRGFSTVELIQYIKKYLLTTKSYVLLCLDEIDSLELDKDYSLLLMSLTQDEVQESHNLISLILISKRQDYLFQLDTSVRTHLEKNIVFFRDYTRAEMRSIIEDRFQEALLCEFVDNSVINCVINNLKKNDPRLGLEILWRAVREAEHDSGFVTPKHVNIAVKDITPDANAYQNALSLRYQLRIFLYLLIKNINDNPKTDHTTIKEIQLTISKYKHKLKNRMGLGYTSLYNFAQELRKYGIISIDVSGKHRKGRTSILRLNVKPSVLIDLLNEQDLFKKVE